MRSYSERNIPKQNCIGSIMPFDILRMAWFTMVSNKEWQASMPQFDNKVILDFWAGISDFANTINQLSQPKRLAVVDLMYQDDDFYNTMLNRTRDHVALQVQQYTDIKKRTYLAWDSRHQEEIRYVWNNIKRMLRLLRSEQHHDLWIEKYVSINEMNAVWKCDFIFATHILYHFSDRLYTLALLWTMLNQQGKMYIIDYDIEWEKVTEFINILRHQVELWNVGITEINSFNGNACFEITQRGAIDAYAYELKKTQN